MFYGNEAKPGLRKTRAAIQICAIHPPPVHECEYVCDQNTRGRHVHVLVRWAIKEKKNSPPEYLESLARAIFERRPYRPDVAGRAPAAGLNFGDWFVGEEKASF